MIRKPQYKVARRLGERIYPKTQTQKFALRAGAKGGKSQRRPGAKTEYGQQFLEKQKVKLSYGLMERQFAKYVREAREHGHKPAEQLYTKLETRLDNIVYRIGFASSRTAARQMVAHGHVTVNDRVATIPSYAISPGTKIGIRSGSKGKTIFKDIEERLKKHAAPDWLTVESEKAVATVRSLPSSLGGESTLNFHAVLELYSRS